MSSAVIHLVVPTLVVIATGLFPRKTVLLWLPFTVVPDFDFIFNFFGHYVLGTELLLHRAIFHNVFIGLPSGLYAWILWRRMLRADPELAFASWADRWLAFARVPWGYAAVLVTFFLESHVLLDMFQGGVTPLWPLWNLYVYPRFIIWVDTTTGLPTLDAGIETGTGAPALSPLYPWLVPEEVAILILCLIAIMIAVWAERRGATAAWLRTDR